VDTTGIVAVITALGVLVSTVTVSARVILNEIRAVHHEVATGPGTTLAAEIGAAPPPLKTR
jgi:hypothetical protein